MTSKPAWTRLAMPGMAALALVGVAFVEACAQGDATEDAPADAGGTDASTDTNASEASAAGGSAGQGEGGAAGEGGSATGGASGKGGSSGTGGGGQGGTGGGEAGAGGEAPDGGVPCGSTYCFEMVCTPDAGLPNIKMAGCCAAGDVCGAEIKVNCVTPEQAAGLGFTCHPK